MGEIYLSTPRGVITNIGDRYLVDMLDNRRKVTIVEFLRSLPNPEKIQAASTDMYRPYREAIQEVLPHVVHVLDKITSSGWATKPWSAFGDGSRTLSLAS